MTSHKFTYLLLLGALAATIASNPIVAFAQAPPGIINNVLANGDFESGPDWGGAMGPDGWHVVGTVLPPQVGANAIGGNGRSMYLPPLKSNEIGQQNLTLGSRFRLSFDFVTGAPVDGQDHDTVVVYIENQATEAGYITFRITDDGQDGIGEFTTRPGFTQVITGITNLFTADVTTGPLVANHLVLDGHFDDANPYYDIFLTTGDGTQYSATNLQNWHFGPAPETGSTPDSVRFVSSKFETAPIVIDNVQFGTFSNPAQPGDFDGDGDVDGSDFATWQTNFPTSNGATLTTGDGDGDGDIDGADFVVWQTHFPFTPSIGASPVPEPDSLILLSLGSIVALARRRTTRTPASCYCN